MGVRCRTLSRLGPTGTREQHWTSRTKANVEFIAELVALKLLSMVYYYIDILVAVGFVTMSVLAIGVLGVDTLDGCPRGHMDMVSC